jgi:hypothetical protein
MSIEVEALERHNKKMGMGVAGAYTQACVTWENYKAGKWINKEDEKVILTAQNNYRTANGNCAGITVNTGHENEIFSISGSKYL